MADGSTMTLPPPSFVVNALEHLDLRPGQSFLDVGCGTGYVSALAACLLGDRAAGATYGVECVSSRLEQASGGGARREQQCVSKGRDNRVLLRRVE